MTRKAPRLLIVFISAAITACGAYPREVQVGEGIISRMEPVDAAVQQDCVRRGPGRVTLELTVNAGGKIERARLLDNTGSRDLGFCVMAACAKARFPKARPFEFTYSFDPLVTSRRGLKVNGPVAVQVAWQVINVNSRDVDNCMASHGAPGQSGSLTARFSIRGTGAVRGARVTESDLGNDALERCVVEAIRSWRFPEPRDNGVAEVSYTFELERPRPVKQVRSASPARKPTTKKEKPRPATLPVESLDPYPFDDRIPSSPEPAQKIF